MALSKNRLRRIEGSLVAKDEQILDVFPSHDERQRLVLAVEAQHGSARRLVLRQETYSSVGWFVQSRVAIAPEQVPGLKVALSSREVGRVAPVVRQQRSSPLPHILRLEGTAAGRAG